MGHFARDCRAKGNQDSIRRDGGYNGNKARDNGRRPTNQDDLKALVTIDGEDNDWSRHVEEDTQNYAMITYSSSNSVDESDAKTSAYTSCESNSSAETTTSMPAPVENALKVVCEPKVWSDAPIIEEYESDSDNELVSNVLEDNEKPSFTFTDTIKHVKPSREMLKKQAHLINVLKLRSRVEMVPLERVWVMLLLEHLALFVDDPHKALKDKGIIDSGCSRHMIGNKAHLVDYQEFKGCSVAFGVAMEE
nr:hypothetical protein [Tanacetum cinerariifolium]